MQIHNNKIIFNISQKFMSTYQNSLSIQEMFVMAYFFDLESKSLWENQSFVTIQNLANLFKDFSFSSFALIMQSLCTAGLLRRTASTSGVVYYQLTNKAQSFVEYL